MEHQSPEHLRRMAAKIRRHIVSISARSHTPHVAPALSCTDILVALYFNAAKLNPQDARDKNRDRIILSKGHAAAALYACLAERGFFPVDRLMDFAKDGSGLAEHPSWGTLPGIECSTGSLGHGLGIGIGMALSLQMEDRPNKVYVVLSDGECNEGSTWESALWAPKQNLGNLTAIIDFNKFQATGPSTEITHLEPLGEKWKHFGWHVLEVNGHSFDELPAALREPANHQPRLIVAHTVKGKGVSFMENDLEWHYRPVGPEDLERATAELNEEQP